MNIEVFKKWFSNIEYYGTIFQDNLLFYGGKLAGRIVFPIVILLNQKQYVKHISYYPECELKSNRNILYDQILYALRYGEVNKNYFIFGFDRKNKNDFNNDVCLVRDKFVFEAYCRGVGINTPKNIGLVNYGKFYSLESKSYDSIDSIVNLNIDAFCKRNVTFGGGTSRNIFKLIINNGIIYINDKKSDLNTLKKIFARDHWVVQHSIKNQSEAYSRFHPNSINTTRIVTIKNGDKIEVLCSFFRMGVNGRHADNWSSGGILTGVDIKTGELEKWGFFKPGYGTKSDCHPNSNLAFEGYKLPHWDDMVEYVKKAHSLFYGLHSIGWDVVVTDDGITLIEGNDNWDTIDAQFYKGAMKEFNQYFK